MQPLTVFIAQRRARILAVVDLGREAAHGLAAYDLRPLPLQARGNLYLNGARPYARELSSAL